MKGSVIAIGDWQGRGVAARFVDGVLDDLFVDGDDISPGAILRGRVGRPVKGLGGAFVDLPDGTRGFLRQTSGLAPGQPVLVQVSGVAEPGKAVPLTTRLVFKGRFAILTPGAPGLNISRALQDEGLRADLDALARAGMQGAPEDLGAILRSACAEGDLDEIAEELGELRALALAVLADTNGAPELLLAAPDAREGAWREWPAPDIYDDSADALEDHGFPEAIAALLDPVVPLSHGGQMIIEPTRALVAVDVNTGPDTSPAAGLKACLAAARALPRELRLRGLGGQVVIDFAPCPRKDRAVVEQALKKLFRSEGAETTLAGWTPLGNFELQRKRDRAPLASWAEG